jgi:hypothetical protein
MVEQTNSQNSRSSNPSSPERNQQQIIKQTDGQMQGPE